MSLSNAGKTKLAIALLPCMFVSGCGNDPASNSHPLVTDAAPIPQKTLSTATSPPAGVIEALRTEMREAAPAPARERHPASKLVGEGCEETSFSYYDVKGDQTQYIGLYSCAMRGAILGISKYDSQVHVIGQILHRDGEYMRGILSAQASN